MALRRLDTLWRGQLFLFDRQPSPSYSRQQGYRLLLIILFEELVLRQVHGSFSREVWWPLIRMPVLLLSAMGLVVWFGRVPLVELGMYPWRRWSTTEKHFFPQIMAITLIVFAFTAYQQIRAAWQSHHWWQIIAFILIPQMVWGFYQEFLYRGLLQTELVRRQRPVTGILVTNLIFTFGPLHFYHFGLARANPAHLGIFAGIFAIGLYFAVLYWRSGNLWMVGILHGVGDFFIDGLPTVSRLIK